MGKSIIRLTLVITAVISVAAILIGCGYKRLSENMDLKRSYLIQNGIAGDSLLITAAHARVGVTYRFKGSETGYIQGYEVLTATELKNLNKDIDR